MILPRDDYYLAVCTCEWFEECPRAPFKAQRLAAQHARREESHRASVVNMTRLEVTNTYSYERLDIPDDPPF